MGMQAGGKPMVGRLQAGSAPWRLASSTRAARARSRGRSSRDSAWARARERARGMAVERDHDVAVFGGDPVLVACDVGGDPEQQAGVARLAGRQAADRVRDQRGRR